MNSRFRPPSVASKHAAEHDAAMDRLVAAVSAARRTAASERGPNRLPATGWTRWLAHLTPAEAAAADEYRHQRGLTRSEFERGKVTAAGAAHRYQRALDALTTAAAGSPSLDRFIESEQHYLQIWKGYHL